MLEMISWCCQGEMFLVLPQPHRIVRGYIRCSVLDISNIYRIYCSFHFASYFLLYIEILWNYQGILLTGIFFDMWFGAYTWHYFIAAFVLQARGPCSTIPTSLTT